MSFTFLSGWVSWSPSCCRRTRKSGMYHKAQRCTLCIETCQNGEMSQRNLPGVLSKRGWYFILAEHYAILSSGSHQGQTVPSRGSQGSLWTSDSNFVRDGDSRACFSPSEALVQISLPCQSLFLLSCRFGEWSFKGLRLWKKFIVMKNVSLFSWQEIS